MTTKHQSRKLSRANWWFQQMREVVDKAVDWQPKHGWYLSCIHCGVIYGNHNTGDICPCCNEYALSRHFGFVSKSSATTPCPLPTKPENT
jgi:hypothetical protein